MGEIDLVTVLVQGGFAAAFFWLLIDTRRESAKREDKLMGVIECYGTQLSQVVHEHGQQLANIAAMLHEIQERLPDPKGPAKEH